jgi:hypothetical protein
MGPNSSEAVFQEEEISTPTEQGVESPSLGLYTEIEMHDLGTVQASEGGEERRGSSPILIPVPEEDLIKTTMDELEEAATMLRRQRASIDLGQLGEEADVEVIRFVDRVPSAWGWPEEAGIFHLEMEGLEGVNTLDL